MLNNYLYDFLSHRLLQRYAYHIGIFTVRHVGDKYLNLYDLSGIRST